MRITKLVVISISLVVAILVMPLAQAQEITLKQGMVYTWEDGTTKNLTCVNLATTTPNPKWPKLLNAIWSGNVLDVGMSYDMNGVNSATLLIGREFGTLKDYLPISFPYADKIKITIYPLGVHVKDITDKPRFEGCSGGAIINLSVKFW